MFIRQGDCNFRCSESSPSKGKVMMASIDVGEGGIFSFRFFFFQSIKCFESSVKSHTMHSFVSKAI